MANVGHNMIEKFDSSGQGSVFASFRLAQPVGLAFDSGGDLYAADQFAGRIEKMDSNGNASVFASGMNIPYFIAVQIPEPATWSLLTLGIGVLFGGLGWRHHSSRSV